jgi:hypothetical protein
VDHQYAGVELLVSRRPSRRSLAIAAALQVLTVRALAELPTSLPGYSLTAASQFEWDPNLFRLPDSVSPRQVGERTNDRADAIIAPSAAIDANLLVSRQRFHLSARLERQILLNNPTFDITDLTYRGAWQWQLGNEWSGGFNESQLQQRPNFADVPAAQKDLQTTRTRHASLDYRPRPDRRIGASFDQYVGSNSLGALQINDYRITVERVELGLDSGFGSEIVFGASQTRGNYPNQPTFALAPVDNSYRQSQLDLSTHYVATEQIRIDALAGYAKRHYPVVSRRNFGGLVGHLAATWQPTGKLQVELGVNRDLNSINDFNRIYTVSTDTRATLHYQPTFKTDASIMAHATRVLYQGDPHNFLTSIYGRAPYREDRYDGLQFQLSWLALSRLTLQVAQAMDYRNSNVASFQYRDWTTTLTVQYVFGTWY